MRKAERRNRIFLDWLRNERGATAVLPYSVCARETPTLAAPVTWAELAGLKDAKPFSTRDADTLAGRAQDKALKGSGEADQSLPDL